MDGFPPAEQKTYFMEHKQSFGENAKGLSVYGSRVRGLRITEWKRTMDSHTLSMIRTVGRIILVYVVGPIFVSYCASYAFIYAAGNGVFGSFSPQPLIFAYASAAGIIGVNIFLLVVGLILRGWTCIFVSIFWNGVSFLSMVFFGAENLLKAALIIYTILFLAPLGS
jgi:hypothetical protein